MSFVEDPPWAAKLRTLEFFTIYGKWIRPPELIEDPLAGEKQTLPPKVKSVSVRLLRYFRQGLLERRRVGDGYEYRITYKGEKRLLYLWRSKGYLDEGRAGTDVEKAETRYRLELSIEILRKHRELRLKRIVNTDIVPPV